MTERLKKATVATVTTGKALRLARLALEESRKVYDANLVALGKALGDNRKAQLEMEQALDAEPLDA